MNFFTENLNRKKCFFSEVGEGTRVNIFLLRIQIKSKKKIWGGGGWGGEGERGGGWNK